jgi:hypothetical protein
LLLLGKRSKRIGESVVASGRNESVKDDAPGFWLGHMSGFNKMGKTNSGLRSG